MKYITHHALARMQTVLTNELHALRVLLQSDDSIYKDMTETHDRLCEALDPIHRRLKEPYEGETYDHT